MGLGLVQELALELEQRLGLELELGHGQHRNTRLKEG